MFLPLEHRASLLLPLGDVLIFTFWSKLKLMLIRSKKFSVVVISTIRELSKNYHPLLTKHILVVDFLEICVRCCLANGSPRWCYTDHRHSVFMKNSVQPKTSLRLSPSSCCTLSVSAYGYLQLTFISKAFSLYATCDPYRCPQRGNRRLPRNSKILICTIDERLDQCRSSIF